MEEQREKSKKAKATQEFVNRVIQFMSNYDPKFCIKKLAVSVGCDEKTVGGYANGIREASFNFILACIELCRTKDPTITYDSLMGLSNEKLGQEIAASDFLKLTDEAITRLVDTKQDNAYHILLSYLIEKGLLHSLTEFIDKEKPTDEKGIKAFRFDVENWCRKFAEDLSQRNIIYEMKNRSESLLPITHYTFVAEDLTTQQAEENRRNFLETIGKNKKK